MKLWSIAKPLTAVITALILGFVLAGNSEARGLLGRKLSTGIATLAVIALSFTPSLTGKVRAQNSEASTPAQVVPTQSQVDTLIPLYEAVRKINRPYYSDIEALLKTGKIDVNARDHDGNTGLHIMVQKGFVSIDTVQLLLDHGFDATIVNNEGKTARAYVTDMCGGEPEALREVALWTKAIYGINGKDASGRSPLEYALWWSEYDDSLDLVQQLVEEGATFGSVSADTVVDPVHIDLVDTAILREMSKKLSKDVFREIVKRRGEGDITSFLKKRPKHLFNVRQGEHYLELAVQNGNVDVAEFLLEHGVNPNFFGEWKKTPLHFASEHGGRLGLSMVSILLARGAYGNYKEVHKLTPYGYKDKKKNPRPVDAATYALLLLAEVGAEGKDAQGRTPMYWAELSGSEIIQKIVAGEIGITKLSDRKMRKQVYQELREAK